ncbi:LysR family transcriptional regulator [Amycolatopsis minnesotensis]|uniref:LysR substrate-binding domain-containing protein n=1 Tax=Amycolatopsis minnesotensis TaxID=337894 RepID=A0ABN2RFN0_9PSEU
MEIRELRYFVAVCRERHFGRAAEALYISQPSLSHAIKKLETRLGVRLLDRHARGVDLTPAGADLLAEARKVLLAVDRAHAAVGKHRTGKAGTLRLGFQASGAGALLTEIRAAFQRDHRGVTVVPLRYDWGQEVEALRAHEIDIAVVWQPQDLHGLRSLPLTTEERYLGLPAAHPLATRTSLSIMDIKDVPLTWTRHAPPTWVSWWAVNPRPDGSHPVCGAENRNVEEQLENVASGAGAAISPASMTTYYSRPDIRWVLLHDVEPLRIDLAWNPGEHDPIVAEFVAAARARTGST